MTVDGGSELAWQQSIAARRLQTADATGMSVRQPVRKSQVGAPEDAQVRTVRLPGSVPVDNRRPGGLGNVRAPLGYL